MKPNKSMIIGFMDFQESSKPINKMSDREIMKELMYEGQIPIMEGDTFIGIIGGCVIRRVYGLIDAGSGCVFIQWSTVFRGEYLHSQKTMSVDQPWNDVFSRDFRFLHGLALRDIVREIKVHDIMRRNAVPQ